MNRLPALSVARLRIFAGLTIAAAAAISFESIRHLAVIGGFGTLAILFPLTLDAVAAYGMDLWVRRSPAARQAKWLALAAIFGSLIANVVDHWLTQRAVLGAVLGAVPPGMLAALLAVAHKHASGTEDQAVRFDPAVRDAVWSALPQADRHVVPPPDRYLIPDRIVVPVRSGPVEGPAVGPMVRRINVPTYDELDRQLSDRSDVVRSLETKLADRSVARRTSAARTPSPAVRRTTSATVHSDSDIVTWIKDQPSPTKRAVMAKYSVGSGRALRLIAQSKEA